MSDRLAHYEYLNRLGGSQLEKVKLLMQTGRWWTVSALAEAAKGSPHAMSARISELRREGLRIVKKYVGDGIYLYRMVPA